MAASAFGMLALLQCLPPPTLEARHERISPAVGSISLPLSADHSPSATVGSSRVALRPGTYVANKATAVTTDVTVT